MSARSPRKKRTGQPDQLTKKQSNIYLWGLQLIARFRAVVAGRRFGKTFLLKAEMRRAAQKIMTYDIDIEDEIWYGAPTFKQAKRVFWRRLKQAIPAEWLAKKPNETECVMELITGHVIRCVGLSNYDDLRGSGLFFCAVDETADIPIEAWNKVLRPMLSTCKFIDDNGISQEGGHALFIGTPKGFNHFYDFYKNMFNDQEAIKSIVEQLPNTTYKYDKLVINTVDKKSINNLDKQDNLTVDATIISHKQSHIMSIDEFVQMYDEEYRPLAEELFKLFRGQEWKSWHYTSIDGGNVPQKEVESARKRMDARTFRQEYMASFENYAGVIYYCYDKELNRSTEKILKYEKLFIGMDFNVDNMHAGVHVVRGPKENRKVHLVDEIIKLQDTRHMIREIQDRYPDNPIAVYPDSSGKNRKTSGSYGESDITLLRDAGFEVYYHNTNPPVKDRINAFNSMLCNAYDERRYFVNYDNCPVSVQCLLRQTWNEKDEPDKTTGHDHMNDANGYFVAYEFGLDMSNGEFYGRTG